MTIPIEFLACGGIAVYFIIGFFVGRRVFRSSMKYQLTDDAFTEIYAAFIATLFWPIIPTGYILLKILRFIYSVGNK